MKEKLHELFQKHAWQAFTQMKLSPPPVFIERGEGIYLFDDERRKFIDAIGSWWVNIHGHSHPYINEALNKQMNKIEHSIYAGLAHAPAIELSEKLSETTDHNLNRVFYSDNGSTAVEVALKMAYQYFTNQGQKRTEFISLGGAYHGDTFGAMSVGSRGDFHKAFEALFFNCHQLPKPSCPFEYFNDEKTALKYIRPVIEALERILRKRKKKISAIILEPLLQGAAGAFNFYPPVLLRKIYEICKDAGILVIADEVFTGYGRTGKFYASQFTGLWPDIMPLSKALAAGYLPFAATLATEDVYQKFYSDERSHALLHGHSMTANPLGCAVALASLELFQKDQFLSKVASLETWHKQFQEKIKTKAIFKKIKELRCLGSVGVIELKIKSSYTEDFAWSFMQKAMAAGVLVRPLANVIYFCPPYCINQDELEKVYTVSEKIIEEIA